MDEREINLADLLLNILLHWRGLILLMLAGGILFGAYSYISSDREAKALQKEYDEQNAMLEEVEDEEDVFALSQRLLEEQMTKTQIANVLSVITNEELMAEKNSYLESSVLMQLDANNVPEEWIVFAVLADDSTAANNIALVYENILSGNGLNEYLSDKFNIAESAVDELYSIKYATNRFYLGTNSFSMAIVYSDKDTCQSMAQAVIEYAASQTAELKEYLGEHELVVLGQYYSESTNTSLLNTKKTYVNDVMTLETAIAKAKDAFSDEEVAYYNCLSSSKMTLKEDEEEEIDETESELDIVTVVLAHISVKYVLLGAVLFVLAYACLLAAIYVFDNRLKRCDNMQEIYKIPQLGCIELRTAGKRKPLQFVDNMLNGFWNRNRRSFSVEESVKLAATAVKIAAVKSEAAYVSIIGCNMKNGSLDICEQIKSFLANEGIRADILDNVIYDAEAMERLTDSSCAVLVENVASTLYSEIDEELALLKRQNIKALGGIIVAVK
ncbi:MAG: hypothetical protein LUG83_09675 [Lachnospiraceae bacterium]|nr:hypothetical protein [Lachnospiraceae bacterium]